MYIIIFEFFKLLFLLLCILFSTFFFIFLLYILICHVKLSNTILISMLNLNILYFSYFLLTHESALLLFEWCNCTSSLSDMCVWCSNVSWNELTSQLNCTSCRWWHDTEENEWKWHQTDSFWHWSIWALLLIVALLFMKLINWFFVLSVFFFSSLVYANREGSWVQRKKPEFQFMYAYLEDDD